MFNLIFDNRTYVHMLPYGNEQCFSKCMFNKMGQWSSTKKIRSAFSFVENDM